MATAAGSEHQRTSAYARGYGTRRAQRRRQFRVVDWAWPPIRPSAFDREWESMWLIVQELEWLATVVARLPRWLPTLSI